MNNTLLQIFGLLLVASVAANLSLKQYFRQKEYEIIVERYLREGIDLVAAYVDHANSMFTQDYIRCRNILSKLKGSQAANFDMPKELYLERFLRPGLSSYCITPFYKLKYLLDNDIFLVAYLGQITFMESAISFFEYKLCYDLKALIEKKKEASEALNEFYEFYNQKVEEFNEESLRYYDLLDELQNIARILERERPTFKELQKLRDHKQLRQSVKKTEEAFRKSNQGSAKEGVAKGGKQKII